MIDFLALVQEETIVVLVENPFERVHMEFIFLLNDYFFCPFGFTSLVANFRVGCIVSGQLREPAVGVLVSVEQETRVQWEGHCRQSFGNAKVLELKDV